MVLRKLAASVVLPANHEHGVGVRGLASDAEALKAVAPTPAPEPIYGYGPQKKTPDPSRQMHTPERLVPM